MTADVHALAGAYALDALPEDEAAAFRAHLADCAACRQEVAEFTATTAQLGSSAAEAPPERLREQVLRAASETRQEPPVVPPAESVPRRRRWPRVAAAAAAGVLVAGAGAFVGIQLGEDDSSTPIAAVVDAPDARSDSAELQGGGTLTMISSQAEQQAVVLAEGLPELPSDRVYQLWLVDPGGNARPAEVLLEGSQASSGSHLVPGMRADDQVAITSEPAGGSQQPTTEPLAVIGRA